MKQRLGGLLTLSLGAVLIFNGLGGGGSGNVGAAAPPSLCGAALPVGQIAPCPQGQITITSVTDTSAPGSVTPPTTWSVTITSTCLDPNTNAPVNRTVAVPNSGSVTSDSLYVFTNTASNANCDYILSQTAVAGFTTTFAPKSPVTLPYDGVESPNERDVTLNNVAAGMTSTSASASTSTPSSTAPAPSSQAPSSSSGTAPSSTNAPAPSPSSGALANTGTRNQIGVSLWIGIALCLLGLALLFEGRVRRIARHRG